jgi:predicted nucleic acid-binding protein
VLASIELHRLQQTSFWDAMIVHAARISGAAVLYTEDLQHGSSISGVEIINPFAPLKTR